MTKKSRSLYPKSQLKRAKKDRSVIPIESYIKVIDIIATGESIKKLLIDKTSELCFHGQPSVMAFYNKIASDDLLRERYQTSKKAALLKHIDQMHEIANDDANDLYTDPASGSLKVNGNAVQRSKLKINTTQWLAEHILPEYKKQHDINVNMIVNLSDMYNSAIARIQQNEEKLVSTDSQVIESTG